MTNLTQYEKGCSPSAIQCKYSLTYAQGYELAERLKKTQELELENTKLKDQLEELNGNMDSVMQTNKALCKKLVQAKELFKRVDEYLEWRTYEDTYIDYRLWEDIRKAIGMKKLGEE